MSAFCIDVERKKTSNILSRQESPFAYPINHKRTFSLFVLFPSSPLQSTPNTQHTHRQHHLASLKLHETSTDAASTFTLRRGSTSSTLCAAAANTSSALGNSGKPEESCDKLKNNVLYLVPTQHSSPVRSDGEIANI